MIKKIAYTLFLTWPTALLANEPKDWQLGFQKSASKSMDDIVWFHDYMLVPIITAITAFVLFLLLYVCVRYRASKNQVPSTTSHNTLIEVIWTLVPCLILIVMAVPSFKVLYSQDEIPKADVTIKAIGYQWYWGYEYPDENIIFDSYMIDEKDLKENQPRLLAVDNAVYVPVNKVVKVMITANDVLHAWALPSFGVKRDAIPGRINETWFKADRTGTFYGQCSELCGIKHAFMPITVNVVSEDEYNKWLEEAKVKLKKAIEEQDADKIMEANDKLTQLAVEKEKARIQTQQKEVQKKEAEEQSKQQPEQQQAQPAKPSQKAVAWKEKNNWFGQDKVMTNAAYGVHEDLVSQGFDAESEEYYNEIDRKLREYFPHKFTEQKKPVQTVASAGRKQEGRRTVRLTRSQVAIAKKLGVPLEEYAKYVKE